MKKLIYFLFISLFFSFVNESQSRSFRVNQIPNGNKFQCLNCHTSPDGGGQRNPFGETVNDNLSGPKSNAPVRWDLIFNIDSDGDGFTNGEELQDPDGQWVQGPKNPGDPELVTQPWNPNSKPTTSSVENDFVSLNSSVYPSPTMGILNLEFTSNYFDNSSIEIYNSNGNFMNSTQLETIIGPNTLSINLNDLGIRQGIYFLVIRNKFYNIRKRFVFIK